MAGRTKIWIAEIEHLTFYYHFKDESSLSETNYSLWAEDSDGYMM